MIALVITLVTIYLAVLLGALVLTVLVRICHSLPEGGLTKNGL